MKRAVERTANLTLVQCEITGLRVEGGRVCGVESAFGAFFPAQFGRAGDRHVAVTAASSSASMPTTRGRTTPFPPAGCPTACARSGVRLLRFKTGTPPRVHADSIDYSVLEEQRGDEPAPLFSSRAHGGETAPSATSPTRTRGRKAIILENLSPLAAVRRA